MLINAIFKLFEYNKQIGIKKGRQLIQFYKS